MWDLPTILINEDATTKNKNVQGGGYLWRYGLCDRLLPVTK